MTVLVDTPPVTTIPTPTLPEITLRAPLAVPPIVTPGAPKTNTPDELGEACLPLAAVPMKLPMMRTLVAPAPWTETPFAIFPEMTLRSAGVVPPTVTEDASKTWTPVEFGLGVRPAGSTPEKFPAIVAPLPLA